MASKASRYVGPVGHRVDPREDGGHDLRAYRPSRDPCTYCGVKAEVGCRHLRVVC